MNSKEDDFPLGNARVQGSILVVDDDNANLDLLAAVLCDSGHSVRQAANGQKALEYLESELPDLILLDIKMPGIDGFEVCRRLKEDERTRDIPVIFISGIGEMIDKMTAFRVGGVDYITKPFQLKEVLVRVETHLALRNMRARLEQQNRRLHEEIAERERAKEALRKARDELERRVEERTRELVSVNKRLEHEIAEHKQVAEELGKHREHLEDLIGQRTLELVNSEEKYRTIVENVPFVIYRTGPRGELLFLNHCAEETLGRGLSEFLDDPGLWSGIVCDEDRAKIEELRKESFRQGREFVAEYRIKHKNGHIVYAAEHAIPFRVGAGPIGGVDGIIMDVTGRIKDQEKLIRTESLKTISEVSARLAHEIRNPLVSAGGFARQLLSAMKSDDPNRGKVEIIVKEVARLETILRMILIYIQPLQLEMTLADPNYLVEKALSTLAMEIGEKKALVQSRFDRTIPRIAVDRTQMELAVETLVKKALNQMPEGAALTIATRGEEGMFKLFMRYPAPYVATDDIHDFFYPFTTSLTSYDPADLPLSKIIVDKHGGSLEVGVEKSGELWIHLFLPLQTMDRAPEKTAAS